MRGEWGTRVQGRSSVAIAGRLSSWLALRKSSSVSIMVGGVLYLPAEGLDGVYDVVVRERFSVASCYAGHGDHPARRIAWPGAGIP